MRWEKSSYSNGSGGSNCVEVAKDDAGQVLVRNSKEAESGEFKTLTFTSKEWAAFIAGVKEGEFDKFAGDSNG